ncbi:DUF396-domain-containing protein [Phellopilus nigrolimitatus]|nr:DUF396-domain-containing protein [Phellopilus nigrolimitatus]
MTLLHLLSYVGFLAAAGFIVLSLASGLLWISELIEEHSRTAKTIGTRAVYVIIALHALLYLTDSLPLLQTVFSIACHLVYLKNFSHTWPFISLSSTPFIASCVLAIANHFLWFFYFSRRAHDARVRMMRSHRSGSGPGAAGDALPGFADVATFFALCVWLVPLFLFLSLSANDNALPTSADALPDSPAMHTPVQFATTRSSLFKSILDSLPRIRRRRAPTEGIIVTHTPSPSAPSTPRTSMSGQSLYLSAAQSSPHTSQDVIYLGSSEERLGRTRVALRPPPKRSVTVPSSNESARESDDAVVVVGHNSSLHVSRTAEETPVRRRTAVE